jgi:hypothetical protein
MINEVLAGRCPGLFPHEFLERVACRWHLPAVTTGRHYDFGDVNVTVGIDTDAMEGEEVSGRTRIPATTAARQQFPLGVKNAHAPARRIGNITLSPGTDVDVRVHYGLAGRRAIVSADIESIRLQLGHQLVPNQDHQRPKCGLFFFRQIEQAGDALLGNDERVAFGNRKCVENSSCEMILQANASLFQITKRASFPIYGRVDHAEARLQCEAKPIVASVSGGGRVHRQPIK